MKRGYTAVGIGLCFLLAGVIGFQLSQSSKHFPVAKIVGSKSMSVPLTKGNDMIYQDPGSLTIFPLPLDSIHINGENVSVRCKPVHEGIWDELGSQMLGIEPSVPVAKCEVPFEGRYLVKITQDDRDTSYIGPDIHLVMDQIVIWGTLTIIGGVIFLGGILVVLVINGRRPRKI
ncbi:MAG: hypothetical protein HKL80_11815 [Acidimicrobiales bacterium]|nr:hypothetical protein [Acidimicrobiales bacterium]